jgi:GDP-L-fucose synthase
MQIIGEMMQKTDKIYVAGHRGLVGAAICRRLAKEGYTNVIVRTRQELDLMQTNAVEKFFADNMPDYVILAAAKVGGIKANMTYPAEFLIENLQIQDNVIWAAHNHKVKKLLFLGSSCIYPRDCPQPMNEDSFMQGPPEPTNEAYAIAKIAGMKLCEYIYDEFGERFITCMPTNIYGEGDNLNPESSHVIPALMRRMYEAQRDKTPEVVIWGSGISRREFLHCDDLADAVLWFMNSYDDKQFLNVGLGEDISIKELAELMQKIVGYEGKLVFDTAKPDGMPKKLLDVTRLHTKGWHHTIEFETGLRNTYDWFIEQPSVKD